MNGRITRANFLAGFIGAAVIAAAAPAYAARNGDAESYVQQNATAALAALGDRVSPAQQRRATFERLMAQFADMPRIGAYVLGRYGAQLRADASLRSDWQRTFQDYAIATYETSFDRYSGGVLRVTGSVERIAGRDVIVTSQLLPRGAGASTTVQWRVLRDGDRWRVIDISVVDENRNQIWLAQVQQGEFLAVLDRNRGDIRALIADLRSQTASMRQRAVARS